jgi:hypothetical protein
MNRHLLEFWGKALLEAARSQKQMEDLVSWCQQGFSGFQDYTQLFKAAYGLDKTTEDSLDYLILWKKAEENFRKSFGDYLDLLGMVPREDYEALARCCEELKEKVAKQEETIGVLRMLAEEKGMGLEATTLEFQKLINKQGEQFQRFIESLDEPT